MSMARKSKTIPPQSRRQRTSGEQAHISEARPAPAIEGSSGILFRTLWFAITLFTSALLLFLLQPLVGKLILPRFGGAPAVWNTCMVFFQLALLAGYAYAHASSRYLPRRGQFALHTLLLLLPWVSLPVALAPEWRPPGDASPILPLLGALLAAAGLPFLVVSTSAPLLQKWFADQDRGPARDPYWLYAASNAGSLLALIAYPTIIEPQLTLRQQGVLWAVSYAILGILTLGCVAIAWRTPALSSGSGGPAQSGALPQGGSARSDRLAAVRWVALAFIPSSLMLGVTTFLTTDLTPMPLLWVLPLALYLLSFIWVFAHFPEWARRGATWLLPALIIGQAWLMMPGQSTLRLLIPLHLATFFVAALVCHDRLASSRPPVEGLTAFYLWIALGGALGGIFNGLLAPVLFTWVAEYPLALVLALLALPPLFVGRTGRAWIWVNRLAPIGFALLVVAIFAREEFFSEAARVLSLRERSFFSVLRVLSVREPRQGGPVLGQNTMVHGNVRHGIQLVSNDARLRRLPTLYFSPVGPIGQVFQAFPTKKRVAIVGLGIGTLAGYAERGQEFTFFEIDPAVAQLAEGQYFTYLGDARSRGATVRIVLGDARLSLRDEAAHSFDLIILDAFTSDSIPTHLLTSQAMHLYLDKLAEGGIVALHITNAYLDLAPVVGDLGGSAGLVVRDQDDNRVTAQEHRIGKQESHWVIMARSERDLGHLASDARWKPLRPRQRARLWTDDYTDILSAFRWSDNPVSK
jgi:spermidine synthase